MLLAAAIAVATGLPADAASVVTVTPPPVAAERAPRPEPPAFQADLMRLTELLGAVAYLDPLCNGGGPDRWRATVVELLDAQKLDGEARRPYVAAFNRGLRSLTVAYGGCSDRARLILDRLFAEGAGLADRLDFRFGTGAGNSKGLPGG